MSDIPIGTFVIVTKDDGSEFKTYVRSEAWEASGSRIQKVRGIAGGYLVERIRVDPNPADDLWIPLDSLEPPHGTLVLCIYEDDESSMEVVFNDPDVGLESRYEHLTERDDVTFTHWRYLPKTPRNL